MPFSIATDGQDLYVGEFMTEAVRKVSLTDGSVSTVMRSSHYDNASESAAVVGPRGITTDGTNLFVADTLKHAIRKIVIATEAVTTVMGAPETNGHAEGPVSSARAMGPFGFTNSADAIYFTDMHNSAIRQIE